MVNLVSYRHDAWKGVRGQETHPHPPTLMMHIMKFCVLFAEPLQWVPGQLIPAVIVNALEHGERGEDRGLSSCEAGEGER